VGRLGSDGGQHVGSINFKLPKEFMMSAIELVQDVRVGLREVGLAAEKEGARLAKDGQYAEAAEKYR
jgi:hypothetical protein